MKAHLADIAIQEQFGVISKTYWLNKMTGTANCLIEAESAEHANALHKASHGLEAHKIIEVVDLVVLPPLDLIGNSSLLVKAFRFQ